MSKIQSQGFWNTIFSYLGAAFGVLNLIFLYPFFLETDEIGLIRILTSVSILYAQVASLGFNSVIIRFQPHYSKSGAGFPFAVMAITTGGFLLTSALVFALKPTITAIYLENSALFVTYYNWLIPLSLFVTFFTIAESFLRVLYKTVFSLFLREVVLRILTTLGIVGIMVGKMDFEMFLIWYLAIHALVLVVVLWPLLRDQRLSFKPDLGFFRIRRLKRIMQYGLVSLLTGATTYFIQMIDSLMIGAWLDLDQVGIYTIAFFMGSVIAMPARGISRIAVPMIAAAWKKNQVLKIGRIYAATSLLHFSLGVFILTGILINLPEVFQFLPDAFAAGTVVVFWIGIGHLIDITGGLNGFILNTSNRYDRDLYFNIIFIFTSIITNVLLIPAYGLQGAAIASAVSYLSINIIRTTYIWNVYGMHPFSVQYLPVLGIAIFTGVISFMVPLSIANDLIAITLRSVLFVILFGITAWLSGTLRFLREVLVSLKENEV
ncbi:MAG: polysaccharide biosynthesis protein [Bacteroidetes bacterium]|nr:polysaccharide biosynthesis protein [Bacteroidota bacterium]MCH8523553.1 polysaccharide biosynthesis C-terminal domain-containing protein [Balneolales bacterium]